MMRETEVVVGREIDILNAIDLDMGGVNRLERSDLPQEQRLSTFFQCRGEKCF